ncbi:hypothetical protein FE257_007978 [Aspergillus nanangensis]|uniref:Zn(2)-C6 fungal-type domain-containing protein n=1 Tax=Aspergillus nanangensis TaxID=2582783 RepID=A0AAD4GTU5_ASPNN|nr:hypothetical protein FE257_007978 [Aspergillus nanangensis]
MATWPNQHQKEQAIPQLSCALCRDRKLKCDKLDPCSNCTSSGVTCMPIYRPRLPRGRHARPVQPKAASSSSTAPTLPSGSRGNPTNSTMTPLTGDGDLRARLDRLESLVQGGVVGANAGEEADVDDLQEPISLIGSNMHTTTTPSFLETIGQDLSNRIRRLEGLVHETTQENVERNHNTEFQVGPEAVGFNDGSRREDASDPILVQSPQYIEVPRTPTQTKQSHGLSTDFWADIMDHEMHESHNSTSGLNNTLVLNSIALPRDKVAASKLCRVYLRNVDPIIKVLHRPSLSKWMIDGAPYLAGLPEESSRALEAAVCYSAANTMTELQCQQEFQKSKSIVVGVYRRMCEDAIEMAGLLTTRDITVMQAFVLYLIGRRTEERDTAVWALVALAIRITSGIGLNQEPGHVFRQGESFFDQQMRLRLWLTICLVDLQASFAEGSRPLIHHRDAASAVRYVAHINDTDFDKETNQPVPSQEELTDITFALVTYHVQAVGRLLNFASPGGSSTTAGTRGTSSDESLPPDALLFNADERRELVSEFQHHAFTLLHYCDPESSPYAWFTWHSTQSIVSAIRVSELLPFRCGPPPSHVSLPRPEGNRTLLLRALQNLEKAHLIRCDPRGDGFRWYITAPWLALSAAIMECSACTEVGLLRRAWPVIEASYREHAGSEIPLDCRLSRVPLAQLISETREKLMPLIQEAPGSNNSQEASKQGSSVTPPTSRKMIPGISYEASPVELKSQDVTLMAIDPSLPTSQSDIFDQYWATPDAMGSYSHRLDMGNTRHGGGLLLASPHGEL